MKTAWLHNPGKIGMEFREIAGKNNIPNNTAFIQKRCRLWNISVVFQFNLQSNQNHNAFFIPVRLRI